MTKKRKLPHVDSYVKTKLRRASLFWPGRSEAVKAARVERGLYKCGMCGKKCKRGEYELDHKVPVIPLDGKIMRDDDKKRLNFNLYIDRLFVGPEGFDLLCLNCHASKTAIENNLREVKKRK